MKKTITLLAVVFCLNVKAQTVFWTETFGAGTSCSVDQGFLLSNYTDGLGSWAANTTVGVNNTYANIWYVSETEGGRNVGDCGNKCLDSAALTNRTMHIGNVPGSPHSATLCPTGDCGAIYDMGIGTNQVATDVRAESPTISCVGKTNICLQFDYILHGDTAHDYLTVWYYDGALWTPLGKPVPTLTCSTIPNDTEGVWVTQTYNLPADVNNNSALKIGFRWVNNDDGKGNNPSIAIDNVKLLLGCTTTTGIAQITNTNELNIYPNPNNGNFVISSSSDIYDLKAIDMLGQIVYEAKLQSLNTTLTLNNAGIYFITITAGTEIITKKVIINK
jgi:hypothetical protein